MEQQGFDEYAQVQYQIVMRLSSLFCYNAYIKCNNFLKLRGVTFIILATILSMSPYSK